MMTSWCIGQLQVWKWTEGFYLNHAMHDGWSAPSDVEGPSWQVSSLEELRRVLLTDAQGHFRPLRAAPDLRSDWHIKAKDVKELRAIIDYVYPAALANWIIWRQQKLASGIPWEITAKRQSGRFRIVRELDTTSLREVTRPSLR